LSWRSLTSSPWTISTSRPSRTSLSTLLAARLTCTLPTLLVGVSQRTPGRAITSALPSHGVVLNSPAAHSRIIKAYNMHRLYSQSISHGSTGDKWWGIVRYVRWFPPTTLYSHADREARTSQAVYLLAWLMMLHIDEAVSLEFEGLNIIPRKRESSCPLLPFRCLTRIYTGTYYKVRLKT
jgi:hypothetical protein